MLVFAKTPAKVPTMLGSYPNPLFSVENFLHLVLSELQLFRSGLKGVRQIVGQIFKLKTRGRGILSEEDYGLPSSGAPNGAAPWESTPPGARTGVSPERTPGHTPRCVLQIEHFNPSGARSPVSSSSLPVPWQRNDARNRRADLRSR